MSLQLNLEKSRANLQLCLTKAGITRAPQLDLAFALDVSGSFLDEHRSGISGQLLDRLIPWGLTFDPDQQLEVFTFSNGPRAAHAVGAVNASNHSGFISARIVGKVPGWGGGTDYAPVLEKILDHFGWLPAKAAQVLPISGLWQRWLGKALDNPVSQKPTCPALLIVVTDGENDDQAQTLQVLRESQARRDGVYVLFIGISNQHKAFPFIEGLGERFANTGFVAVDDLRQFVALDDRALNEKLLTSELLAWLRQC